MRLIYRPQFKGAKVKVATTTPQLFTDCRVPWLNVSVSCGATIKRGIADRRRVRVMPAEQEAEYDKLQQQIRDLRARQQDIIDEAWHRDEAYHVKENTDA